MRILRLPLKIIFGLLFILCAIAAQAQQLRKIGYETSWSGDANSIQYDKLTHINYAFAIPQSTGSLYAVDNGAKLSSIVSQAHAQGVKVLIAIGGWSNQGVPLDPTFETLAASSSGIANFVNDAMYIVNTYNLDGVDIDWEYPNAGTSSDNYTNLMTALANRLHPAGKLLSAAVVGSGSQGDGVSSTVLNTIDHLNVMAYDANNYDHSTYDYALGCLNYWTGRGIAKNKIVLGVPFYGRPSYATYAALLSQGADPNADTFNGNGYNGKVTIANKASYVKSNGYGGIMAWELSGDATGANSLVTVISNTLGTSNPPPPEGPYNGNVLSLPGRLEAENYDVGGQGVAYSDNTPGNSGNAYRSDDVDVEVCSEGGYDIGYIAAGEYVKYTVNVTSAGTYTISARVAAITAGTAMTIEIPGSATQTINVPNTGAWQTWQTVTISNVSLTAGQKIIKINFTTGANNLNYVDFAKTSTPPPTGPVIVYQNCNNDPGYAVGLQVGTYTTAQLNALGIADNDISTLVVQSGYQVTLYNNDNMDPSGGSYTTTSNVACLTTVGFNDLTSSIKVSLVTTTGNQPPSVTLTAPGNGATYTAPASITVSANASDADGSISKVDFYSGSTLIFSDNSSPYSYTLTNVAAGTYTFTAKATDNSGATTTSGSVTVTVNNSSSGGGCSGIAQYIENSGYVDGSKVKNAGNEYQCKPYPYTGWCNGAAWAYGPGTGTYWTDAWILIGSCGSSRSSDETATVNSALLSNAPNPFAAVTTIEVVTAEAGDVSVTVYNKSGQVVKVLSQGYLNAGTYQFLFDASGLQADMYLVKCNTPSGVITRKIIKTE
jgi:chitinase